MRRSPRPYSQTSPEYPALLPSGRRRNLVLEARQRGAATWNGEIDARTRGYDTGYRNHRHRRRRRDSWRRALRRSRRENKPNHASCYCDDGEGGNPSGHIQSRHPEATPTRIGTRAALTAIAMVSRIPPCSCAFSGSAPLDDCRPRAREQHQTALTDWFYGVSSPHRRNVRGRPSGSGGRLS